MYCSSCVYCVKYSNRTFRKHTCTLLQWCMLTVSHVLLGVCLCVTHFWYMLLTANYVLIVLAICYSYLSYVAQVCYACLHCTLLVMCCSCFATYVCWSQLIMCCSCWLCIPHCLLCAAHICSLPIMCCSCLLNVVQVC